MAQKTHAPHFVVEGNIGAGKSTFLRLIKQELGIDVVYEPTNKWQRAGQKENLLDLFYKDTKRWAYTFQSYAFITRIQAQMEHEKSVTSIAPQVYERSVYCDRYCFAKNCFELGLMTELEWNIYKDWFGWLVEAYSQKPHGFIYLRSTPEVCHQRIQKRSRCEESDIPLSYLESLHERHEEWLLHKHDVLPSLRHVPVLTIDCNQEFETDPRARNVMLEQVASFVHATTKSQSHGTQGHTVEKSL
jgi:deoxyadenosine/deoxycytidine kinase